MTHAEVIQWRGNPCGGFVPKLVSPALLQKFLDNNLVLYTYVTSMQSSFFDFENYIPEWKNISGQELFGHV